MLPLYFVNNSVYKYIPQKICEHKCPQKPKTKDETKEWSGGEWVEIVVKFARRMRVCQIVANSPRNRKSRRAASPCGADSSPIACLVSSRCASRGPQLQRVLAHPPTACNSRMNTGEIVELFDGGWLPLGEGLPLIRVIVARHPAPPMGKSVTVASGTVRGSMNSFSLTWTLMDFSPKISWISITDEEPSRRC
jgi:hypothetical protein